MNTATEALEQWLCQEKSRSCRIFHDDGYGASCWVVTLGRGRFIVECPEVNFIGPQRMEKDGNLFHAVHDGDSDEDWPGLDKTILFAIERANEFWELEDTK